MEGNGKGKSGEQTGQSVAAAAGGCSGAAAGPWRGRGGAVHPSLGSPGPLRCQYSHFLTVCIPATVLRPVGNEEQVLHYSWQEEEEEEEMHVSMHMHLLQNTLKGSSFSLFLPGIPWGRRPGGNSPNKPGISLLLL